MGRWATGARALVPEKTGQRESWGALGIRQATNTGEQTLENKTGSPDRGLGSAWALRLSAWPAAAKQLFLNLELKSYVKPTPLPETGADVQMVV